MANTNLVIKALAKQKGFRLEDIATKLGIGRVSFQQQLARNNMSLDRLGEIADILEVEIPQLFEVNQHSEETETGQEELFGFLTPHQKRHPNESSLICPYCHNVIELRICPPRGH